MRVVVAIAAAAVSVAAGSAGGAAELAATPAQVWVSDGAIHAIAATSAVVYVGGEFTLLGRATGSWVELTPSGSLGRPWPTVEGERLGGRRRRSRGLVPRREPREGGRRRAREARPGAKRSHRRPEVERVGHGRIGLVARPARRGSLVVGDFTKVNRQARSGFAVLDGRTGRLRPLRLPLKGSGSAVASRPGLLYVAGSFSKTVRTRARRSSCSMRDGERSDGASRAPGGIDSLTPSGRLLYATGSFTSLGGQRREGVAAVDLRRHRPTGWAPQIDGYVATATPSGDGRVVYLAGEFAAVGGRSRRGLAAVSARTGSVTPWDPNVGGTVAAVVPSGDGRVVYFGGEFESVGETGRSTSQRIDAATGLPTPWDPATNASVNTLVRSSGGALLAGGTFETAAAPDAMRSRRSRPTDRGPSVDPPARHRPCAERSPDGGRVYVGGRFVSPERNERSMATIDAATNAVEPFSDPMNAAVWTIAPTADGSTVYIGGASRP